jgi:altronate hydrolase
MQAKVLKVHPADNVIVALTDLPKGELIAYENDAYVLADNVPQKHKFVTQDLAVGGEITMYGVLVGKATQPIPRGGLIHTHNVKHAASDYFGKEKEYTWSAPDVSRWQGPYVHGLPPSRRPGGHGQLLAVRAHGLLRKPQPGSHPGGPAERTRVRAKRQVQKLHPPARAAVPVGAVAGAPAGRRPGLHEEQFNTRRLFPNVDGIKFLTHQGGCGGTRQDSAVLNALLASYADHPNVAGVTVLSLGCQHVQLEDFRQELLRRNPASTSPCSRLNNKKASPRRA